MAKNGARLVPIIKVEKSDYHVAINRFGLEDERLSFRARGLLAYLLTKPSDWRINYRHLAKVGPDGEHVVRETLKELEAAGYLSRQRRSKQGRWMWEQTLYEMPQEDRAADIPARKNPARQIPALSNYKSFISKGLDKETVSEKAEACPECGCDLRDGRCGWCGVVVG